MGVDSIGAGVQLGDIRGQKLLGGSGQGVLLEHEPLDEKGERLEQIRAQGHGLKNGGNHPEGLVDIPVGLGKFSVRLVYGNGF